MDTLNTNTPGIKGRRFCYTGRQIAETLKRLPPTEENQTLKDKHGSRELATPFRVALKSKKGEAPALDIKYLHDGVVVWIEAKTSLVSEYIKEYERLPVEKEYGETRQSLKDPCEELIPAARWKAEELEGYGGVHILIDVPTIDQIINGFMQQSKGPNIEKTRRSSRNPSYKNRAYVGVYLWVPNGTGWRHRATVYRVADLIAYIARERVHRIDPIIEFSETSTKYFKRQIKAIAAAVTTP